MHRHSFDELRRALETDPMRKARLQHIIETLEKNTMSYNSYLSGSWGITPPLRWSEYRDSDFQRPKRADGRWIRFVEKVSTTNTDDGVIEMREATGVVPNCDDRASYHNLEVQLDDLVRSIGPDHTVTGYLIREGEEQGDMTRFSVVDGKLLEEQAELRWPDGSRVTETSL